MYYIGIDIGSTAAKVSVFNDIELMENFTMPTGWSSIETSKVIKEKLEKNNIKIDESKVIATGYGRISVPYADKTITEITCHGKGTHYLLGKDCTVIDIGGQDTKIITLEKGKVSNFTMNDKCAAGTGRFLELMANTLGVGIDELGRMALSGEDINITSMCTVFAESEVISLIGSGTKRESIARGIVNSITGRVYALLHKHGATDTIFLTGGLCEVESFAYLLSEKLGVKVQTSPLARYAGSIGAALLAKDI
ncbi:acyl-CoA dehydratase activase [Tissierella sp.]|uniref:acyl-CoA dehydratase activase n=1 Tax=Tissierella sp. TaxID=41274 RepID=UPI0028B09383|nr:acyl-CoA dehydratase activase [Tissierella sp.]